jgi:hypothetical protein
MVQTRILAVGVCAFVLGACAHQGQVTEQQMARVPSGGMAKVDEARTELARAQDKVARQDIAITSAESEVSVAKDDVRVAEAGSNRTETMMKKADFDRNPSAQRDAYHDASLSRAEKEAAAAHLKAANSALKLAKAQKQEAEAERDFATAQVSSRQYDALVETGDLSVKDTDTNAVKKNMDEGRSRVQAAKGEVAVAKSTADQDRMIWEVTKTQFESRRGTGGTSDVR